MSASAPTAPAARTIRTCTRRCGSRRSAPRSRGRTCSSWLTTEETLRAATEGSARALGLEKQIGKIAPGYKADIVFLDLHHINWIPTNDPVNALVHTEDGTGVHSVMIGGRMIVENHKLLTVDLAALAAKVEACTRADARRSPRRRRSSTGRLEKVVGTFCPGLAKAPLHIHRYGASHHAHWLGRHCARSIVLAERGPASFRRHPPATAVVRRRDATNKTHAAGNMPRHRLAAACRPDRGFELEHVGRDRIGQAPSSSAGDGARRRPLPSQDPLPGPRASAGRRRRR